MKKFFISIIFILLACNLFCADSSSQKIHNNTYDINYEITSSKEGNTSLIISSDTGLDMKIKVLCKTFPEALDFVMNIEDQLEDIYLMQNGSNNLSIKDSLKLLTSPIKYLIDKFKGEFLNTSWAENPITGEYYFLVDLISKNDPDVVNGVVTLSVLDCADLTSPSAMDDKKYIWDAFEEAHPNIKIEREIFFGEAFHQRTASYAISGRMPDVFYMWPAGRSSVIHDYKLAKDLTPFLKKDGIYDDYAPVYLVPSLQKGGYVAEIPMGMTLTNCTFANTKVLKECGLTPAKTYDELKAQLPILQAAGKELIIMGNMQDWVMQSCLFSMVVGRMAGPDWADDIMSGKAKFTDKPFLKAVEMIKTMYDDGVLSQESLTSGYGDVTGQFATEKGAYFIDGDWRTNDFLTDRRTGEALISPKHQKSDIELIQFPALPGEIIHNSNSGIIGTGYGMSSALKPDSAKEAAAWELIKWLSGPEIQQYRFDNGVSFPSLVNGIDYPGVEPLLEKRAQFYAQPSCTTPVFDSVFSTNLAGVLNQMLQKLGMGEVTPMEVCEAVQAAYEEDRNEYR